MSWVVPWRPVGRALRSALFLLCLLPDPTPGQAQVSPSTCVYSSPPLERSAPVLLGWSDIQREELPAGVRRELRVHQAVAIAVPDYSLRIVDEGHAVTGELLVTWPGADFTRVAGGDAGCQTRHDYEARKFTEAMLRSLREYLRCGPVERRPRVEGCRVLFTADPGWEDILRRSDAIGIWALSSLPAKQLGLDGVDIGIELRDETGYRRLSRNSPSATAGPGNREVAAMEDLLESVLAAAHEQLGGN
jgi:hypothetical protein